MTRRLGERPWKRRLIWFALIAPPLILLAVLAYCIFALEPLTSHQGDGQFRDLSHYVGPIPVRGYSIAFDHFDLSKEYHRTFVFRRLPQIGIKCGVYFVIYDPDDSLGIGPGHKFTKAGKIHLQLVNSAGLTVVETAGSPRDFIAYGGRHTGAQYLEALYDFDRSFFHPITREEYTLHVDYWPDPNLASLRAFAYLECGGHN